MSAGLLAIYSFAGEINLYPLVYYGLRAMANRGDVAVAYLLGRRGLERLEVDLSREEPRDVRGVAAVGCVYTEDCCRVEGDVAYCAFGRGEVKPGAPSDAAAYVALTADGVLYAYR
ncbi:MAG: amidophosphoribosyltransferase, partial [Pyrobaculum sp.]